MSTAGDAIRVTGLKELQKSLKDIETAAPRELRLVLNNAAGLVVAAARPLIPTDTGAARNSLRVTSTQKAARVSGGSARAPYYGWLDFGGKVGPRKSIKRTFVKQGRYLYPSYYKNKAEIQESLIKGLTELCESKGLKVTE